MRQIVSEGHRPDLDAILAYNHEGVITKLEQGLDLCEQDARQLFEDTKRFLYLAALEDDAVRPTGPIDEGWHTFILFTKDYESFCATHFKRFLHHDAILGGDSTDRDAGIACTIAAARRIFGKDLSNNWLNESAECAPDSNCEAPPRDCALN